MARRAVLSLLTAVLLAAPAGASAQAPSLRDLDRVPADPSLPPAHPVDLSDVQAPARPPDLGATPRIPAFLRLTGGTRGHAGRHFGHEELKREQYRDAHGHVLTLSTDNPSVDLRPFANLLASTYHHGEIEYIHVFVTSAARLSDICGADAAACYGADDPRSSPGGAMVVSYEDRDVAHGVIHEYGHHIDNNAYNLPPRSFCGIDGDGSRRWFFEREIRDEILDLLSCDPAAGWGQLLPEVFAEDYAQLVGVPRAAYHPAILVPPPTRRQKAALKADIDSPFAPATLRKRGRSSAGGIARFRLPRTTAPVFVRVASKRGVRSFRLRGCGFAGFSNVFHGRCTVVVKTKRRRGAYRLNLLVY